jgi:hypothetical protein
MQKASFVYLQYGNFLFVIKYQVLGIFTHYILAAAAAAAAVQ